MDRILVRLTEKCRALVNLMYLQRGFEPSIAALPHMLDNHHYAPEEHEEKQDLKEEGFVWAVPKKRRSLQVRWCRNMGARDWVWKMLEPKTNLRICETCGNHYEAKHLCRTCYEKIKKESEVIREAIEAKLENRGEDQGVVVLYNNEKDKIDANAYKDQMLVEVSKPRPPWFSRNLLQKTTAAPDHETTTVVPKTNLG